jgi:hypothetical protein
MSSGKSTVSDTDLKLFLNLSNPEATKGVDEEADDDDESTEADEEDDEEGEEGDEEDGEEGEDLEEEDDDDAPRHSTASRRTRVPDDGFGAPAASPMSEEDIAYQKTAVLLELDRLRGLGCKLTREYTMADSLEEMEYESRRHVLMLEEQSNVSVLKDGLRLFVSGTEFANRKFGPFLNLDGFGVAVSNEINAGKYNLTLSKLHRKYFKTPGQSSPEIELAFSLMGAAAFHHFQKSYFQSAGFAVPKPKTMPAFPAAADDDDSDDELPPGM